MTLLISYETKYISCGKKMTACLPSVFVKYKRKRMGFNMCSFCRKYQVHLDLNELIKGFRKQIKNRKRRMK